MKNLSGWFEPGDCRFNWADSTAMPRGGSLNDWSNSETQSWMCLCSVFRPCSSSAGANATVVPNIPGPFDFWFLMSHWNNGSMIIFITFWYSKEQAPGYLNLIFFRSRKSATHDSWSSLRSGSFAYVVPKRRWIILKICMTQNFNSSSYFFPGSAKRRTRNEHSSHGVTVQKTLFIPK